jgi:UDP-glucose 4-epimerase
MAVVVLRPPLVYGAAARANLGALFRLVARAPVLPFGSVCNRRSLVHVDHLADAIAAVVAAGAPDSVSRYRSYLVADAEPISTAEMIRAIAAGLERRVGLVPVPVAWLRALGRLGAGDRVARLVEDLEVDPSAFYRDFGWRPPRSTFDGLRESAREWARGRERD